VVRPVRRPSDRQNPRRHSGGDPREICNHVEDPSREARVFLFRRAGPAWQTAQAKATTEQAGERTPRCVSLARRAATLVWAEMAGGL